MWNGVLNRKEIKQSSPTQGGIEREEEGMKMLKESQN